MGQRRIPRIKDLAPLMKFKTPELDAKAALLRVELRRLELHQRGEVFDPGDASLNHVSLLPSGLSGRSIGSVWSREVGLGVVARDVGLHGRARGIRVARGDGGEDAAVLEHQSGGGRRPRGEALRAGARVAFDRAAAVSYTHLTLPT